MTQIGNCSNIQHQSFTYTSAALLFMGISGLEFIKICDQNA